MSPKASFVDLFLSQTWIAKLGFLDNWIQHLYQCIPMFQESQDDARLGPGNVILDVVNISQILQSFNEYWNIYILQYIYIPQMHLKLMNWFLSFLVFHNSVTNYYRKKTPFFKLESLTVQFPCQLQFVVKLELKKPPGSLLLVDTMIWMEAYWTGTNYKLQSIVIAVIASCSEPLVCHPSSLTCHPAIYAINNININRICLLYTWFQLCQQ